MKLGNIHATNNYAGVGWEQRASERLILWLLLRSAGLQPFHWKYSGSVAAMNWGLMTQNTICYEQDMIKNILGFSPEAWLLTSNHYIDLPVLVSLPDSRQTFQQMLQVSRKSAFGLTVTTLHSNISIQIIYHRRTILVELRLYTAGGKHINYIVILSLSTPTCKLQLWFDLIKVISKVCLSVLIALSRFFKITYWQYNVSVSIFV